ncbi:MAG: hypothetical protein ACJAV4_000497 [Pontimonas sp.]|jgi:hypothetical protein
MATSDRAAARIDLVVQGGGIVDPREGARVSVIVRSDETGTLGEGVLTLSITDLPFGSEEQVRRFVSGASDPVFSEVVSLDTPEVPQLESREIEVALGPKDLPDLGLDPLDPEETEEVEASGVSSLAGVYGLEATYSHPANAAPSLRQLANRQLIVFKSVGETLGTAPIAPIVTLTTTATGGIALRPEELQALTISGGPLNAVTSAVERHAATLAIDSRITSSIAALGDQAPIESVRWALGLGRLGLAQFSLPWADADPLASLDIDTLVYARLGEFPWVHGAAISDDQLATLATRSASAVLLSSDSLPSDRAVVSVGNARIIRVDEQLSGLARDALQAPTLIEAQADLQRAAGIIAFRAIVENPDILVFSTGRLPATAIAPRIDAVLESFSSLSVAEVVAVPLTEPATEVLPGVVTVPLSRDRSAFVANIKTLWERDVAFATIAADPEGAVYGRWTRYQALLSSTWSEDPNGLATEWERAQENSRKFRNSVRVEQGSDITVLADQTSLPVTVQNDLPSDVVVALFVRPTTGILAIENPTVDLLIPANSSVRALVPVQSLANGTTPVEFTLLSQAGDTVGDVVTIPITIRAGWEGVISLVLAALVGGTFTFGMVRAIQRRRKEPEATP